MFQRAWPRVFAAALAVSKEPSAAEDAAQSAIEQALQAWRGDRWPDDAVAWLITAAKRRALDQLRHSIVHQRLQPAIVEMEAQRLSSAEAAEADEDLLRLVFMCCHPSLSRNAQIALTLRHVGGLTAAEIARASNSKVRTIEQRIIRATQAIRQKNMVIDAVEAEHLRTRLPGVLDVIALIFSEGYNASSGSALTRVDLVLRATNMIEDLVLRVPRHPEVRGLAALCAYQASRLQTKMHDGEFVPLEKQDRTRWDQQAIQRGNLHMQAVEGRRWGYYGIQAAIAACHANAATHATTDWDSIVRLYNDLSTIDNGLFVQLNRLVALLKSGAVGQALAGLLQLEPQMGDNHYLHATLAEAYTGMGEVEKAQAHLRRALVLAENEVERAYLHKRLREID